MLFGCFIVNNKNTDSLFVVITKQTYKYKGS